MRLTAALISLFYIFKLSIQSLSLIVKAKYNHRKAKVIFTKNLIHEGVPQEAAEELAKVYPNPINEIFSLSFPLAVLKVL